MKHFFTIFLISVFLIVACLAVENKYIFGLFIVFCPILFCALAIKKARNINKLDFNKVNKDFIAIESEKKEKNNISEIKEGIKTTNSATDSNEKT